ncbi:MAG TPA: glycosyltransferase [Deltaproteobacteria bacterium]|nr:glycosyltransferase [Deltaproteobacteria bacterium]HPR53736.1 glycosyltransferase [Deltaproteobacteria bacterium]HXK46753.1 glycosyltransferase [Deltaproteobacteria bacterium]
MKVLLVTTSYPDHPGSQRGIFIRELCLALFGLGIKVMVLTPRVLGTSPTEENDGGIIVRRFRYPSGGRQLNQMDSIPVLAMSVYMVSGIIAALRAVMTFNPDVIHGNWIVPTGLIASLTGFLTGTPVVNTARGMDTRVRDNRLVRALFTLAVRLSDRLTVVSDAMRSIPGLESAEVISSGVDPVFFEVIPDESSRTVLFTRSLEPVYDAATLIRSVPLVREKIPGAAFVLAGSGSQEEPLRSLARDLGIADHVTFLGHVPHENIPGLASRSRVFVSSARADGTSIALQEAMAAGLIPVVTDIEANRALVTHGRDGYLFEPGNEKDLAENIINALSGEINAQALLYKRLSLKGKIVWSTVADRFISGYNQLMAGHCG